MKCKRCGGKQLVSYENEGTGKVRTLCVECRAIVPLRAYKLLKKKDCFVKKKKSFEVAIPFALSSKQRYCSAYMRSYAGASKKILLHAICGAGKTEMIALVVARFLQSGKSVGWAIARRDVVVELAERLKEYFPQTSIIALYQGSPDIGKQAQFIVLTTARLMNYYQRFDCLVVDENDAYPFNVDARQQYASQTCLTLGGTLIHISATITKKQKRTYDHIVSLSERFHKSGLPPIFFKRMHSFSIGKMKILDGYLKQYIKSFIEAQQPVFIFVPTIAVGLQYEAILKRHFPKEGVKAISSKLEDRSDFLEDIRIGKLRIVITTTILERGVTFDNVQVIVINSDASIFDAQTLIQIAGRVGRTMQHTSGNIIFMYQQGITRAMYQAQAYHRKANKGEVMFIT